MLLLAGNLLTWLAPTRKPPRPTCLREPGKSQQGGLRAQGKPEECPAQHLSSAKKPATRKFAVWADRVQGFYWLLGFGTRGDALLTQAALLLGTRLASLRRKRGSVGGTSLVSPTLLQAQTSCHASVLSGMVLALISLTSWWSSLNLKRGSVSRVCMQRLSWPEEFDTAQHVCHWSCVAINSSTVVVLCFKCTICINTIPGTKSPNQIAPAFLGNRRLLGRHYQNLGKAS